MKAAVKMSLRAVTNHIGPELGGRPLVSQYKGRLYDVMRAAHAYFVPLSPLATRNQLWYARKGFPAAGGIPCSKVKPPAAVRDYLELRVRRTREGEWETIALQDSLRGVVVLNLQSYGGANFAWWGTHVWGLGLGERGGRGCESSCVFAEFVLLHFAPALCGCRVGCVMLQHVRMGGGGRGGWKEVFCKYKLCGRACRVWSSFRGHGVGFRPIKGRHMARPFGLLPGWMTEGKWTGDDAFARRSRL